MARDFDHGREGDVSWRQALLEEALDIVERAPATAVSLPEGSLAEESGPLTEICVLLLDEVPGYDRVGIYVRDPDEERQLMLAAYAGEALEMDQIPFGRARPRPSTTRTACSCATSAN